jgi:hypothetical protein
VTIGKERTMPRELWKIVEGFEAYEVSNLGKVRRRLPGITWKTPHILKPSLYSKKYYGVTLCVSGKKFSRLVHILVASAFIPNPLGLPQVNHQDGNKKNCKADNLEWRSNVGNHRHAVKLGLFGQGVDRHQGKWRAQYNPEPNKRKLIGYFSTKQAAQQARRDAVEALPDIL